MPAVPEYAVVGPIRGPSAHGGDGHEIHQEHHHSKNGQCQPAVGDHSVNFVGGGQGANPFFSVAALHQGSDINIPLVGNDALGVIVQFRFCCLDVFFNVVQYALRQVHAAPGLFVPLEELDGVPALLFRRHVVYGGLLNVGNGVLHCTGEGVHGNGFAGFGSGDGCFSCLHDTGVFQSGDFHHGAAQSTGELLGVDFVPVFSDHVHHVNGNHHGDSQLCQLGG